MKQCPYCAEQIQDEAIVCRFCNRELVKTERLPGKHMPAIGWGVLVGLIIALLTITRRGDTVADALYLMQYPPLDQLGKQYLGSLVVGSIINLIVWTLVTTGVILVVRKIFRNQSEARVLIYSLVVLVILFLSMTYFYGLSTLSTSVVQASIPQPTPTSTRRPAPRVTPTRRPTATTRPVMLTVTAIVARDKAAGNVDGCYLWSKITLADKGKTLCVYGTALSTYHSDGTFYVTFGDDNNDFYFVSYGDFWYDEMRGNCVMAKGKVEQIGKAPVIVVPENNFFHCE